MPMPGNGFFGYKGKWAYIDLSGRRVTVKDADREICRDYIGGRGLQARLIYDHLRRTGPLQDPLGPGNRIILGMGPLNDSPVATAGRGSCSFIGTMTRSPEEVPWVPEHKPLFGLITHSSAGGLFHNMLKRAGLDQLIIDGRASSPVRILVSNGQAQVIEAEEELFEVMDGKKVVRPASAITDFLSSKYPGSSTVCLGPAGWNKVAFACLTADHHRNFGRGGAGAVFGSKNLVAITASGRASVSYYDEEKFQKAGKALDDLVKSHVADPQWTASFRPTTGTTWWLDRAFNGKYLGKKGGYLPWHNYDEGSFDPADYAKVGTDAFLEITGKHKVCNRCRHVMCTRAASVEVGAHAGSGVRPEFETIALWINCGILDRDAIFHMNFLCNELGLDTMTLGSVMSGAMELAEKGYLKKYKNAPAFGSAAGMVSCLKDIAYGSSDAGRLLGGFSDLTISEVGAGFPAGDLQEISRCLTTAFGGLGYAGIEPKVFPGMFTAYGTSNRGRGDHTYAWTIQAEEGGLVGAGNLASYVAAGQTGKALVDSMGLCDFFPEDVAADLFLSLYYGLTGFEYSAEAMKTCGVRIYALERHINSVQGRGRAYDAYVPAKLTEPLSRGAHKGKAVDPVLYESILDAYYDAQGWTRDGIVESAHLHKLGIQT